MLRQYFLLFFLVIPSLLCAASPYEEIEDYFNSIHTFQAEFKQFSPNNVVRTGNFYLSKPDKIKWEYLSPKKILIMSTGKQIIYCDYELEETSYISSNSVLMHFLTQEKTDFSRDLTVENYKKGANFSELTVSAPENRESTDIAGKLTLIFKHNPLELVQINVEDNTGQKSEVIFFNIKTNHEIPRSVFIFKNPKFFTGLD